MYYQLRKSPMSTLYTCAFIEYSLVIKKYFMIW